VTHQPLSACQNALEIHAQKLILARVNKVGGLVSLGVGIVLLSSCSTTSNNFGPATTHMTYSRTVNQTTDDSPVHVYLNDYWKAVYKTELHDDLQYKQTLSTSGVLGEQRFGFQTGVIEIDYSISKAGAMKIENVRAPQQIPNNQISLARSAMRKAAQSLKPPPHPFDSNADETIRDTMVFDYR
jgi:hypothetical protein